MTINRVNANVVHTADHKGGDGVYKYSKLIIKKNKDGIRSVYLDGFKNETLYSRGCVNKVDWMPIVSGTYDDAILNRVVTRYDLRLVQIERFTASPPLVYEVATFWLEQYVP